MYEDTFEELLALCQPYLPLPQAKKEHEQAFRSYTRKMQLLVAVYCLAHIPTLRMVSEHFSMPHNSVSVCCIKRGVSAIVQALYRDANVIRWPRASSDLAATCRKFEFEHRLRGCCGAIDGTTIPMRKPTREKAGGDSDCYWNYKGHAASLLLAVVDCDLCFTYINAGSPENIGDAGLYNLSNLRGNIHEGGILLVF